MKIIRFSSVSEEPGCMMKSLALVGHLWNWDSFCRFGSGPFITRQAHYASFLVGAHRSHSVIRERFISTANSLDLRL